MELAVAAAAATGDCASFCACPRSLHPTHLPAATTCRWRPAYASCFGKLGALPHAPRQESRPAARPWSAPPPPPPAAAAAATTTTNTKPANPMDPVPGARKIRLSAAAAPLEDKTRRGSGSTSHRTTSGPRLATTEGPGRHEGDPPVFLYTRIHLHVIYTPTIQVRRCVALDMRAQGWPGSRHAPRSWALGVRALPGGNSQRALPSGHVRRPRMRASVAVATALTGHAPPLLHPAESAS